MRWQCRHLIIGAEALAVSEKYRFKNVVISGRFCREDSNVGPSKNSSHRVRNLDRRQPHRPRPALLRGAPGRRPRGCRGRAVQRRRIELLALRPEHLPAGCPADRRRAVGARRHDRMAVRGLAEGDVPGQVPPRRG